jgi:hypothetical protein
MWCVCTAFSAKHCHRPPTATGRRGRACEAWKRPARAAVLGQAKRKSDVPVPELLKKKPVHMCVWSAAGRWRVQFLVHVRERIYFFPFTFFYKLRSENGAFYSVLRIEL